MPLYAAGVATTCFTMFGVSPRHDLRPSFLLHVLVCTYLLCASHTVFSYSRVKHLTRPVDNFYGLRTNYTSRLDLYVYSYHLIHSGVNIPKPSECTATDPCLTLSDTNSIIKQYLASGTPTRCLITFYLVADPLLECQADAGAGISFFWKTSDSKNTNVILLYRSLLLPGCKLVSVNACQGIVFSYYNFIVPIVLQLQNMKLNLAKCQEYSPVIFLAQPVGYSAHITMQNCIFVIHNLCRKIVYIHHKSQRRFNFTMNNCTTDLLSGTGPFQCNISVFYLQVDYVGPFTVSIRDSNFRGASLEIVYTASCYDNSTSALAASENFKVAIENCQFLNLQNKYAADIKLSNKLSLFYPAEVEISDVVVTNRGSIESAFRVLGVHHVRIVNCRFHFSNSDDINAACGLQWRYIPVETSISVPRRYPCMVHILNCTLMRSIAKDHVSTKHSTRTSSSPFIILHVYPDDREQTSNCVISNLTVRDYDPLAFTTPLITTKNVNVTIDGNTDIK